jgi:cellulose synthase/poly-beta-1,6-N-acetylglucosamine synthase-like glycosyltransferase
MLAVSEIILLFAGLLLAVPVVVVFLQVMLSVPRPPASKILDGPRGRVAVLVPAHDEELVIGETLDSISRQLTTSDRLVLVADNCSDRTAQVARDHGAEVVVRTDPVLRGKGFAMDHGLKFLQQTGSRETVIFVDADCELQDNCIDRLARMCALSKRPTQAVYLMVPPHQGQDMALLSAFAWKLKNFVRPLGWHRANFPCEMQGSGMAFPWELIRSLDLASADLAEDKKLGLDLALKGFHPQLCPDAVVTSSVAAGGVPSYSQRVRWEHGTMELMMRYVPRLFAKACRTFDIPLAAMALDLSVPPLALFAIMLGAYSVLTAALSFGFGESGPVKVALILWVLFFMSIVLAWWRYGRDMLPIYSFMFVIPSYLVRKLPVYASLFASGQREWVKSKRELGGK